VRRPRRATDATAANVLTDSRAASEETQDDVIRDVRAVVVSWNGRHLLPQCLDSLRAQTLYPALLEIVVVDNGSEDGTLEYLASEFPDVRVVRSERNLGFAGGANLGLTNFRGDFVALVNNDATLAPDALQRMLGTMTRVGNDRVAAVTARIILAGHFVARPATRGDTPPIGGYRRGAVFLEPASPASAGSFRVVNSTGNTVTRSGRGQDRDWLRAEGEESGDTDVFGFCGGAALLRRAALDAVGAFDGSLFLYYEDTDLSWRLRAHGWVVRYEPSAEAVHRHAASSDASSAFFHFHNIRNSLIVMTRHAPAELALAAAARQLAAVGADLLRGLGGGALAQARRRAVVDFGRRLPRSLNERRSLWRGLPRDARRTVAHGLSR